MKRLTDVLCWSVVPMVWLGVIAWTLMFFVGRCGGGDGGVDTVSVVKDSVVDTVIVVVRDTVPVVRKERVVSYVAIPAGGVVTGGVPTWKPSGTVDVTGGDSVREDEQLVAVVQREYSDDSTYTAWVSGLAYQVWPKLDSINVRQREIVKTITETVTIADKRKARWQVGVVGGYGYGLRYGGFEPFVGVGVSYRLFPPRRW